MIRTEKIILNKNKELLNFLESSTRIYNKSLYFLRQAYFKSKEEGKIKTPNYNELYKLVKEEDDFKNSPLDFNIRQKSIKQAINNWTSFIKASICYNRNSKKFLGKPKIPNYLKKGKLNYIEIDKNRFKKNKNEHIITFCKCLQEFKIPTYIKKQSIKCLRILTFYDKLKLEIVYEKENKSWNLNENNWIGIDIGLNNLATITSNNQNLSLIINGRPLKSINQYFNKKTSYFQSKFSKNIYSSKKLEKLSRKRKNKINNYLHWASKEVIDICLGNDIGNIVIGKNKNWKQDINLGRKNNQNFVQIPFNEFINMIIYKANDNGINVFIHEESYTSKIDHLAFEQLSKQENYLGTRIKRDLFKSSTGKILNADCNGAIGILRKINVISDVDLINLRNRGDVVSPLRINKMFH